MSIVGKFEAAMQGLFEGSIGRVFRAGLQEAELKDRLELAMVDGAIKTRDGLVAPRKYDIYLSRDDYKHFMQSKVWEKLTIHLDNVNRQRGYRITPGWSWRIRLHEDDSLIKGQLRIVTGMNDSQSALDQEEGIEATRTINADEVRALDEEAARAQPVSMPPAWLTLYRPTRGQPMRLEHPITHIGRHLTNEIIVNDRRVSRHHAEIRYEHGQFVVYDLGSTNGIKINGAPTRNPVALRNNDLLTVGSHEFIFQRR
jgi:FHA domain/Protein of unknown function (DUF3662)